MVKSDRSWTEINLTNFEHNIKQLLAFLPASTNWMQIVKADAYGHGTYQIARKAIQMGAAFLGVANLQEGILLRYQGIEIPILILSPILASEMELLFDYELTPTIFSAEFALLLHQKAKNRGKIIACHINIDTGMGRSGLQYENAVDEITQIANFSHLAIEGIFSHYAASENDTLYSQKQLTRFQALLDSIPLSIPFIHMANSSAVVSVSEQYSNLVRIGLLSYGIYSHPSFRDKINLLPVMAFKTRISQIKKAKKGESIGYNRTFIAEKKSRYAILPIGYADGYDFLLSNKGNVLLHNRLCPVIGKISMDMTAIDITAVEQAEIDDEVVLLGGNHSQMRAENIVSLYSGSPYELLCQIGRRAKRYYWESEKIIDTSPLLRRDFVSTDYSDKKLNSIIETAIEQRLQSKEIANLVYDDILSHLFKEKDKNILYRKEFKHQITFRQSLEQPDYYIVDTKLQFKKILQHDFFYIACAKNETLLATYFLRPDVEYRWLLDNRFDLNETFFHVTSVKINRIELEHSAAVNEGCLEIRCSHPHLKHLTGEETLFSIATRTYYPKKSHQLTIYINEMTKGVDIEFSFGNVLREVEAIPIFSGRSKFPNMEAQTDNIRVFSDSDEWIMPNSGVVFTY